MEINKIQIVFSENSIFDYGSLVKSTKDNRVIMGYNVIKNIALTEKLEFDLKIEKKLTSPN